MMKKEIKDAVSPPDNKLSRLDNRVYALAVDMACVKTHLGLTELKQDSPASPASPVSSLKPKAK
ncbi:2271_t:CDS:2 [Paraglomus occultum]|uniref:2271_t:CDS:1 n=1 Tax=Paraglomus occultum TaxID=144539 RepID=A0A9N9CQ11_9GLOM|nr:2271_t:CDS:2 [Paraglomus occultum]